jgi:hypothetical protein
MLGDLSNKSNRLADFISLCTKNKALINQLVVEVSKQENHDQARYKSFERNILYMTDLLDFETKQALF